MSITEHDRREGPVTKETASFSAPGVQSWLGPFNEGVIEGAEGRARVTGPCGDTMEITLRIQNERIVESRFQVTGCAVSRVGGNFPPPRPLLRFRGGSGEAGKRIDRMFRMSAGRI